MNKKILLSFIFYLLVLIVLCLAIYQRLQIPFVPFDINDQYFLPTVSFFKGHGLDCGERAPIYPLLLFIITYFTNNFSAIVYVQVFFGIITALLLLFLFLEITSSPKKFPEIIRYFLALLLFSSFILSDDKINLEFSLRPEIFSQFFLVLLCYLFFKILKKGSQIDYYLGVFAFLSLFTTYFQDKFFGITLLNILIILKYIF